jgi:glucokinase
MTRESVKNKVQSVAAAEAELLKRVRLHGRISRVALSHELNIVPSTAGIYVDRLIREGFLLESAKAKRGLGRPPRLLGLNPQGGRFVGVDFEARNLMATAVDFSQRPLRQTRLGIRANDSVAQILEKMENAISEVLAGDKRPPLGIGVGVPGVIDPARGVAVRYDLIKGWQAIPLGARLRKKFHAPVFLENNVRCMALAELWFGAGRGLKDFICIGVRSGIAAGVVADGNLLRGAGNQAGEIGHWFGPPEIPDKKELRGKNTRAPFEPGLPIEKLVSLSALLELAQRARERKEKTSLSAVQRDLSIEDFFRAVRQGDAFAQSLIESAAWVHGWSIAQLCSAFDPRKIIFAGPLAELGDLWLRPLRASALEWGDAKPGLEIICSVLGNYNGALGAAALALHEWKPKR